MDEKLHLHAIIFFTADNEVKNLVQDFFDCYGMIQREQDYEDYKFLKT